MITWRTGIALGALLAAWLGGCNTGSETGNPTRGLTGSFKTLDGLPAAHTRVILVPVGFNPLELISGSAKPLRMDTTDAQGRYRFTGIDSGNYNLEAVNLSDGTRSRRVGIAVAGTIAELPVATLLSPGKIAATLVGASDTVAGYVYIPGTTFYEKVGHASGIVAFDSLPAGRIDSLVYADPGGMLTPRTFAWNVSVFPDGEQKVAGPYLAWKHSATISLDTKNAVKLSGAVPRFPLGIALDNLPSVFAQARPDGSDLRVTNEQGLPLPCELQMWDAGARTGRIWALVDTVYRDSLQKLRLYWGYTGADAPTGAWPAGSVFALDDGYAAAWHLDEDPFLSAASMRDQSGRRNEGTAVNYAATGGNVPGVIGNGLAFDGKTQFLFSRQAFDNPNVFTFSAWFRSVSDSGGRLIDFVDKDSSLTPNYWDRLIEMHPDGTAHFGVYPPTVSGTPMPTTSTYKILSGPSPMNDGQWHHLAARLSPRGQAFFLDGVRVSQDPATVEGENVRGYWRLGYGFLSQWAPAGTSLYWQGALDEVWIAHAERSDDFVKLLFENQKAGSRLLSFP